MAIEPRIEYPGQTLTGDAAYPYGKARNITVAGDGTGTPLEERWVNDLYGHHQDLLDRTGQVPNGEPDEVGTSQYSDAISLIAEEATHRLAVANHDIPTAIPGFTFLNNFAPGIVSPYNELVGFGGNGTNAVVIYTVDGKTWAGVSGHASTFGYEDGVYTGTRFVAVSAGYAHHSTNLVTWTVSSINGNFDFDPKAVTMHGSRIVAVGLLGTIWTSDDNGAVWTQRTPAIANEYYLDVASDGTRLCKVGIDAAGAAPLIHTSDDGGVTWSVRTFPASSATEFWRVGWNGYVWVVVGNSGKILWSLDAVTWNLVNAAAAFTGTFKGLMWTGAIWVATGTGGEIQIARANGKGWRKIGSRGVTYEIRALGRSVDLGMAAMGGPSASMRRTLMW